MEYYGVEEQPLVIVNETAPSYPCQGDLSAIPLVKRNAVQKLPSVPSFLPVVENRISGSIPVG